MLARCEKESNNTKAIAIGHSKKARVIEIARQIKWSGGQADQNLHIGQNDFVMKYVLNVEYLKVTCDRVKTFVRSLQSQTRSNLA